MTGALVNAAAILLGGVAGLLLRDGVSKGSCKKDIMQAMGLAIIIIAIKMALQSQSGTVLIASLALGAVLGGRLDLDGHMERFAARITKNTGDRFGDVGKAFVSASMLYCVGAMGIVGALSDGLTGDASVLYTKAMLDGAASILFAASMGAGALLAAVPVLLYEGIITLGASSLSAFFTDAMLAEMNGVGGVLVLAIGLNMLEITDIRIANLLPALFVAFFLVYLGF
ncbi:MAG: DUF554 domain-containing protein [Schwartzia sp.]|nr:DUF554 domain-containing protein [Schwartzia sp. (in: firmicutes)]